MTIKEAIKIFNNICPNKKVIGYTDYQGFKVVITEFTGDIESNYYIIVDKEHVLPTNPIMINLDDQKVVKL